ncbi:MAG: hypothetical protein D6776_02780, partial [Planctomycetota bacterium]
AQAAEGQGANFTVEFTPGLAPPPAFASVCVVSRFPEYILLDFGSIDPHMVEPIQGGQKATLQHTGRVAMPESAARRLLQELQSLFGQKR